MTNLKDKDKWDIVNTLHDAKMNPKSPTFGLMMAAIYAHMSDDIEKTIKKLSSSLEDARKENERLIKATEYMSRATMVLAATSLIAIIITLLRG